MREFALASISILMMPARNPATPPEEAGKRGPPHQRVPGFASPRGSVVHERVLRPVQAPDNRAVGHVQHEKCRYPTDA